MASFNNYPYGMPYQPYMAQQNQQPNNFNNMYQQPQLNQFAFVNGVEGAKAYQIMPNQTMMLMDSENPVVYMKQSNALGQSTLKYFKLLEIKEQDIKSNQEQQPSVEYALKADLDVLTEKMNNLSEEVKKALKTENKGE